VKLEKNGVTYDLTNPDTIKAFVSSGWVEVPEKAEEAPKRTRKAKAE
jgi:hypothetical protein